MLVKASLNVKVHGKFCTRLACEPDLKHTRAEIPIAGRMRKRGEGSKLEHGLFAFHDHGTIVRFSWKLSLRTVNDMFFLSLHFARLIVTTD